ncbi:MAG: DNA/RNA non-specific endonuclease [Rikenellaceae bacterium]
MAKIKNKARKKSSKRKPIKISSRQNRQAVVVLLVLIVAIFIYTTNQNQVGSSKTETITLQAQTTQENQPKNQQTVTPNKTETNKEQDEFFQQTNGRLELPYYNSSEFIIHNEDGRYILYYDTARRSALWVAHILTRKDIEAAGVARTTSFKSDPEVVSRNWPTATSKDYTNTGYDRGHLLPSADRDGSRAENAATFYMSNVAPQEPNLNRQSWKYLEEQTRRWAQEYDSLYIVTGTLLDPNAKEINNGIDIPSAFYKALLVKVSGEWHSQAYLMPNIAKPEKNYELYAISIDELEAKAGLDLFYNMDDRTENRIEATTNNNIFKK